MTRSKDSPQIPVTLIAGFLGAGKTTALAAVARKLIADGKRVGIITNDQHFDARIIEVRPHRIEDELAR